MTVETREALQSRLEVHGLVVLGVLDSEQGGQRVLVGNAGSSHWPAFQASPEFQDGLAHPMDRWSRRIGSDLAARLSAQAIFPFEGPPYPPFLSWAGQSGAVVPSPISLYFHEKYGLWHAYRFALMFDGPVFDVTPDSPDISACEQCEDQPCLKSCPVNAFSPGSYRVNDCIDFLHQNDASNCRRSGCLARKSCPHLTQYQYDPAHAKFHMTAFLKAHSL